MSWFWYLCERSLNTNTTTPLVCASRASAGSETRQMSLACVYLFLNCPRLFVKSLCTDFIVPAPRFWRCSAGVRSNMSGTRSASLTTHASSSCKQHNCRPAETAQLCCTTASSLILLSLIRAELSTSLAFVGLHVLTRGCVMRAASGSDRVQEAEARTASITSQITYNVSE